MQFAQQFKIVHRLRRNDGKSGGTKSGDIVSLCSRKSENIDARAGFKPASCAVFPVLIVFCSAVFAANTAVAISETTLVEGKALVNSAKTNFEEEKFDTALAEYEKAYELLEGYEKRFMILFNIGKCHEQLGRFESAIKFYKNYLKTAGHDAEDRQEVKKALLELEKKADAVNKKFAKAKSHIKQGEAFFKNKDYSAALAEFEKAHEQLEGHPLRAFVLYNVGQCYEKIFKYHLALKYYNKYIDEAGENAEDMATVKATVAALENLLGTLIIETNVEAEVWVDGSMTGSVPGEILVPGGRHTLEIIAPGYENIKKEIQITARGVQEHSFELSEIVEYEGLGKGLFWTGTALTIASMGTGIIFGSIAIKKDKDGHANNPNLNQEDLTSQIDNLSLTADIMYGTAALFAIGTAIVFFLTNWGDEKEKPQKNVGLKTMITPTVSKESAGFAVQGRF